MERLAAGRASCSETGKERSNARLNKIYASYLCWGQHKIIDFSSKVFLVLLRDFLQYRALMTPKCWYAPFLSIYISLSFF